MIDEDNSDLPNRFDMSKARLADDTPDIRPNDVNKIFQSREQDLEVSSDDVDFPTIRQFLESGEWDAYDTALVYAEDANDLYGILEQIGSSRAIIEFYGGLPHQEYPAKIQEMVESEYTDLELSSLITMGGNDWENYRGLHYPEKGLTDRGTTITELVPEMVRQNNTRVLEAGLEDLEGQTENYRDTLKYIASSEDFRPYENEIDLEEVPGLLQSYSGPLEKWEEELYLNTVREGFEEETVRVVYTVQDLFNSFTDKSVPKKFLENSEAYYGDILNTILASNGDYDNIIQSWTVKANLTED